MSDRYSRQSFLGEKSRDILAARTVAIVGLSGGGSHMAQQLAHTGIENYRLFDPQRIEESNLHRIVGASMTDVRRRLWKTAIAARVIRRVNPEAKVAQIKQLWQNQATMLNDCDIIVGCVDSYKERDELERHARRYCIPYLDIGMDVYPINEEFVISGQVIVSMPGEHCLRCVGFLNEDLLTREATGYGAAGAHPQVVWANGTLASLAVGVLIQLFTPWQRKHAKVTYMMYDGNTPSVNASGRLDYLDRPCPHFAGYKNLGNPWFQL